MQVFEVFFLFRVTPRLNKKHSFHENNRFFWKSPKSAFLPSFLPPLPPSFLSIFFPFFFLKSESYEWGRKHFKPVWESWLLNNRKPWVVRFLPVGAHSGTSPQRLLWHPQDSRSANRLPQPLKGHLGTWGAPQDFYKSSPSFPVLSQQWASWLCRSSGTWCRCGLGQQPFPRLVCSAKLLSGPPFPCL